jgi:uncharacterized membrane protein YhaH (DUF805 family)
MTVGQWYMSRGRIRRRVYWLHYVLPIVASSIVAAVVDRTFDLWLVQPSATQSGVGALSLVVGVTTLVPSFSAFVTRLHDLGHSAWWMLWVFFPFVGALLLFVETGFVAGSSDDNQYGPPANEVVRDPVSV